MSAFSNFLEIFRPGLAQRRRQGMVDQMAQRNLEALLPFTQTRSVATPYQLDEMETFGPEDPLAQLQATGRSGLFSTADLPGFFNQEQARGLAGLLVTNPQFANQLFGAIQPKGGQQNLFAKINPKDYTQSSIRNFQSSGDYSSLKPVTPEGDVEKKANIASSMRGQFNNLSKSFTTARDAFGRVIASVQNPSPMGDLALIFNYMKVLDPGSTVREGEFAQVGRSGNLPTQVQAFFDQYAKGNRLTNEQRQDVFNRSQRLYVAQLKGQESLETQYKGIASRNKLDPRDVVINYRSQISIPAPQDQSMRVSGMIYKTPSGPMKWTGTGWIKP